MSEFSHEMPTTWKRGSVVPPGLAFEPSADPSDESLGYFRGLPPGRRLRQKPAKIWAARQRRPIAANVLSSFAAVDVFGAGVGEGFFDALEVGGVGAEFV